MLGRGDVRFLYSLLERRSVGTPADFQETHAKDATADAAAWPESSWLSPLRRLGGRAFRGQGCREWHGCVSRVRRAQRSAEPGSLDACRQALRQACSRDDL